MNQFYGHTHRDEFKVFYNTVTGDGSRPISSGFVTPSVTPHTNVNLAYRIYTADGDYEGSTRVQYQEKSCKTTKVITNKNCYLHVYCRECWTMTPTLVISPVLEMKLNLLFFPFCTMPSTVLLYFLLIMKLFSPVCDFILFLREDLGLESLFPADYDGLVRRLRDDDDLWQRYYSYYVSASPTRGPPTDQDRYDILCEAVRTDSEDDSKCQVNIFFSFWENEMHATFPFIGRRFWKGIKTLPVFPLQAHPPRPRPPNRRPSQPAVSRQPLLRRKKTKKTTMTALRRYRVRST